MILPATCGLINGCPQYPLGESVLGNFTVYLNPVSTIHCILVNVFGEVTGSTYSSLEDNTVLISDTTLYCVTENKNTPEVMWSYVDLAGTSTDLTSTTDASTGVSTIQVSTTQPGYYSCEVTENGGSSRMYTAGILSTIIYPGSVIFHCAGYL